MKPILYILPLLSIISAGSVAAQDLSTEVVVERSIVPQEQQARRPSWLIPSVILPTTAQSPLVPATYTSVTNFSRLYSPLAPASGAFAAEKSPYKGYISAGYFPTLDFGVSAGYRFLQSDKISLGARVQFDSERYRPYNEDGDMGAQYFAAGCVGVDFSWRPVKSSVFSAFGQYDFLREKTTYWYPQNLNAGKMGVKWHSKASSFNYWAGVEADFGKASDTYSYITGLGDSPLIAGFSQQDIRFDVGGEIPVVTSRVGAKIDGDYVHTTFEKGVTAGYVGVTPYYSYSSRNFAAKIGVKVDFAKNIGTNKVYVMPDVKLQWTPVSVLGVWAEVTGDTKTNPFSLVRQECVYQIFTRPYDNSRIPVAIDGGINFGPFKGFYTGVFGGYAVADNWLMDLDSAFGSFSAVDVKGWHAGLKIGGEWKFIKGEVSADFAPSSFDRAWYMYRDRAATVVDASIELTPLKPFSVNLGYQWRGSRKAYMNHITSLSLGCVSNLSAGAEWRFTPALSVFARVENILGRRYMQVAWQPSRRQTGLIGLTYKF